MKRDAVITSLLLVNACLLVYVAILVWQRPNLHDIDARIEYWHDYYREVDQNRRAGVRNRDSTIAPTTTEAAKADSTDAATRDENASEPTAGPLSEEPSSVTASELPEDAN